MKLYLISFALGLTVGVFYSLMRVQAPTPPLIGLVGLLGMLAGQQLLPAAKKLIARAPVHAERHAGSKNVPSGAIRRAHVGDSSTSAVTPIDHEA